MYCSQCGNEFQENSNFCPHCGFNTASNSNVEASTENMHCRQCGNIIRQNAEFCPACGHKTDAPVTTDSMYCPRCANTISATAKFCPFCGGQVAVQVAGGGIPQISSLLNKFSAISRKVASLSRKKLIFIASGLTLAIIAIILLCTLPTTLSDRIEGTYAHLTSDRIFVFEQTSKNAGTFEVYDGDKALGKEHLRYEKTWTRSGDVLTLLWDDDTTFYFQVIDDALIELDSETDEPSLSDYIAPTGILFDYKIDNGSTTFEFFSNGTIQWHQSVLYTNQTIYGDGTYYVDGNAIYCQKNESDAMRRKYGSVYLPDDYTGDDPKITFWMYGKDRITRASDVFVKE